MDIKIVLATDSNYVGATGVAVESAIAQKNNSDNYIFTILHTGLDLAMQHKFEQLSKDNVLVECKDISSIAEEVQGMGCRYLTAETLYRLYIPEIFDKDDKVLYFDGDMIVLDDLAKIYNENIEGYILGAVMDVPSFGSIDHYSSFMDSKPDDNFNAGILLINCKEFIKHNIKKKCLDLLIDDAKKTEPVLLYMDNDALNIACYGRVKMLDMKWNAQPLLHYLNMDSAIINDDFKKTYLNALENPKIIHYTGRLKPWTYPGILMAEAFWDYERVSAFHDEITSARQKEAGLLSKRYPYWNVKPFSRLVLYGAGDQGKYIKKLFDESKYADIVSIIDKRGEEAGAGVKSIDSLATTEFDCILITIENEKYVEEAYNKLVSSGISPSKIKWMFGRAVPWER